MAVSFPSRITVSWTVSPGLYSPIRLAKEPATPILTPLILVIMSFSFSPALAAGPFLTMAE